MGKNNEDINFCSNCIYSNRDSDLGDCDVFWCGYINQRIYCQTSENLNGSFDKLPSCRFLLERHKAFELLFEMELENE